MVKPLAIHPHCHSYFSLDGASSPADFVNTIKSFGGETVVLTEHGNMNSAMELATIAKKEKMRYANGIEAYIRNPFLGNVIKKNYSHITIHFRTRNAYYYFCKLSSVMEERSEVKWGERKPIILLEELLPIKNEITVGTGCLLGFVNHFGLLSDDEIALLKKTREELIEEAYLLLKNEFPYLFVEIFPTKSTHNWINNMKDKTLPGYFKENLKDYKGNTDLQKTHNEVMIKLVEKHGGMLVFSDDSHFTKPEFKIIQDVKLGNGMSMWKFHESYHLKDSNYCSEFFKKNYNLAEEKIEEIINNSYILTDWLKDYSIRTSAEGWILPASPVEKDKSKEYLLTLINKERMPSVGSPDWYIYQARLEYEISVLKDNPNTDFLPYIFLVHKFAKWAKECGVLVNLRGSGGGCLLNYLLEVSVTDPLKYNLQFERFLTLGRIASGTLPDVDVDFSDKSKILERIKTELPGRSIQISTNTSMKIKSIVRDLERTFFNGEVRKSTEAMLTSLPNRSCSLGEHANIYGYEDPETGEQIEGLLDICLDLKKYKENNEDLWEKVDILLGVFRQKGAHACGTLITPEPIDNYIPITYTGSTTNGTRITGFDPKSIELFGGLKYDLLGVSKLLVIQKCLARIKNVSGKVFEWGEYPYNKEVYEKIFCEGDLDGIFQLHTHTMRPYVISIKPKNIEDLASVIALVRPGCLDAPSPIEGLSNAQYFCAVAGGTKKAIYIHPELIPILSNTHSVLLYQEQTLQIFRDLAGYSYEKAEEVRRGIGKKNKDIIEKNLNVLKEKLSIRGWSSEQIKLLSDQILASSKYSFNKAHAVSYAIVAYNTAYLKYFYPIEYLASELECCNEEERNYYFRKYNEKIISPIINKSHYEEYIIEDGKLIAPLNIVKGIGEVAAKEIFKSYPFQFSEFCVEMGKTKAKRKEAFKDMKINKGLVVKSICAGLFREHGDEMSLSKLYFSANPISITKKQKEEVDSEDLPFEIIDGVTIPKEISNPDKIDKFVKRKALNPLYPHELLDTVSSILEYHGWERNNQKSIPFTHPDGSVIMTYEGLEGLLRAKKKINVGVVMIITSMRSMTIRTGQNEGNKFLILSLTDGIKDLKAINWESGLTKGLSENAVVLITGYVSLSKEKEMQFIITKSIQTF